MLGSVDLALLQLCALFGPPLALSLLLVLHSLHRCDLHVWRAKVHCYQSADRLHLSRKQQQQSSQQTVHVVQPRVVSQAEVEQQQQQQRQAAQKQPTLREAAALLPRHRLTAARAGEETTAGVAGVTGAVHEPGGGSTGSGDTAEGDDCAALPTAAVRWRASRWLSTSLTLAVLLPAFQLTAWAASLTASGYSQCAATLVLLTVCAAALLVAFGSWQRRGWYWSGHVARLLLLAGMCFIALELLVTYLSASLADAPLSFFSRSVHFVCLHLPLAVESAAVSQQEAAASLLPYIRARERDTQREDEVRRANKRRKRQKRLEAVKRLLHSDTLQHSAHSDRDASGGRAGHQQATGAVEDESGSATLDTSIQPALLSELPSHTHSFASHMQAQSASARLLHRSVSQRRRLLLRVAGVATLVAYSAVIGAQVDAPSASGDPTASSFDGRFMGVLVSLCILLFDACISLLSDRLSSWAQLSLSLFTRLVLIAFDADSWFLAFCLLFVVHGCALWCLWIESILPRHRLSSKRVTRSLSARPVRMTLTSLLLEPPTTPGTGLARPLLATLQSADAALSLPALLVLALVTLFLMSLCVAYTTHPPLVSVPGLSSLQYGQWVVGVLSLLLWLLLSSCALLVRSLLFFSFHINAVTGCASAVVQLLFLVCGVYVWREASSLLVLLLLALLPAFSVSLLAAYSLSIAGADARRSVRSLVACTLCVVLLTALGASLSVLYSPSHVGWSVALAVLVAVSSGAPLVKYRATLTLDALDEWSIILSVALLSGLLALLSWRLSLSSTGNLALAACGTGYALLTLLVAAWSDWRLQRRLTPFSLFVLCAHYVWLMAFAVALTFVLSAYIGVCAVVGVALYICLSLCALYWMGNGYRLPLSLHYLLAALVAVFVAAGAGAAVYLSVEAGSSASTSFLAFSAVYLFLVLCVALSSALQHYGALSRAPCLVSFSSSVFPVVLFDKRSSAVSHLHLPLCLLLCAAALFVLWCLAAIVCGYRDVGLSSSALCIVAVWLTLRELSFSGPRALLALRGVLDEASVMCVRSSAWRLVCSGYEGDAAMLEAVRSLEAGHDARRALRDRQREMRQRARMASSSNPLSAVWQLVVSRPAAPCLDVDWLLASLNESERAIQSVSCLQNTLDAQCAFMLRLEGDTRRREGESLFALFCVWAAKQGRLSVELHPMMQRADMLCWTPAERRSVRLAVDEWTAQRAGRREECERDRLVEECAARRREQLLLPTEDVESAEHAGVEQQSTAVDPDGGIRTSGQARGSSNPTFKASRAKAAPPQGDRARATRQRPPQRMQHPHAHEQRQASHGPAHSNSTAQQSGSRQKRQPHSAEASVLDTQEMHGGQAQSAAQHQVTEEQRPDCGDQQRTEDTSSFGDHDAQCERESVVQQRGGDHKAVGDSAEPASTEAVAERSNSTGTPAAEVRHREPLSVPGVLHSHEEAHALFTRIAAEYDSSGVRWVDADFPAADSSIYLSGVRDPLRSSAVHQSPVAGWQRPDAVLKAVRENGAVDGDGSVSDDVVRLVAGGYSCNDVVQGNIGTCYFLSALGVMALHAPADGTPPLLSSALPSLYNDALSHPCGCYLACFYRRHQPLYVFIDDQLPVQANGLPAFSHCRHAGELWVALMEKAYAKLFGCYEAIEAGYVHQALMDCTSGEGEEVRLRDEDGRLRQAEETLWVRMHDAFTSGCMLGAGSNTGTNDHEVDGIVQGHAYGIIGMYEGGAGEEADSGGRLRLIQLNNPWGRGEWTGEWSDDSDKWTRYYVNRLQPTSQDDGRFWMDFGDFLQHYENVYICRIMPHAKTLEARWAEAEGTACGPRQPHGNPHFKLRADRGTTVHVELEQDEEAAAAARKANSSSSSGSDLTAGIGSNGYAYVQFYLLDNGGQRVDKIVRSAVKGWANDGRLVNARSISAQVDLEAGKEYSLLCCTSVAGVGRAFSVSVFSCEPVTFEAML